MSKLTASSSKRINKEEDRWFRYGAGTCPIKWLVVRTLIDCLELIEGQISEDLWHEVAVLSKVRKVIATALDHNCYLCSKKRNEL